jgi:hypothetical protein
MLHLLQINIYRLVVETSLYHWFDVKDTSSTPLWGKFVLSWACTSLPFTIASWYIFFLFLLFRSENYCVVLIVKEYPPTLRKPTAWILFCPVNGAEKRGPFLRGHISLKNWPKRLLLRHDTSSFKRTCFLIRLTAFVL